MFPKRLGFAALVAGVGFAAPLHAAFEAPGFRGTAGATYQMWDLFTGTTDQTPDVADDNGNGTASLSELGGNGAFVTGGGLGNIYSFNAPMSFEVTIPEADVPTPAHNVTAIVQIKALGTELDYASVKLNGLSPVDAATLLDGTAAGGFGGADVETWYAFNIPYSDFGDGVPGVEELLLSFEAAGSSMSLDRLSVDTIIRPFGFTGVTNPAPGTNPIPEPGTLILFAAGAAMAVRRPGVKRRLA
jgi:hypothetical protein